MRRVTAFVDTVKNFLQFGGPLILAVEAHGGQIRFLT